MRSQTSRRSDRARRPRCTGDGDDRHCLCLVFPLPSLPSRAKMLPFLAVLRGVFSGTDVAVAVKVIDRMDIEGNQAKVKQLQKMALITSDCVFLPSRNTKGPYSPRVTGEAAGPGAEHCAQAQAPEHRRPARRARTHTHKSTKAQHTRMISAMKSIESVLEPGGAPTSVAVSIASTLSHPAPQVVFEPDNVMLVGPHS